MNYANSMNPNSNNFFRRERLLILVLILPFIALAVVWPSLPARVPMHFDSDGNVNRYGSPLELLILPGISVLVSIVLYFIPRLDPKKANIVASMPAYRWIRFGLAAFFTYIFALMLATTYQPKFDVTPFIGIGLLIMFFGIGLAMPKLKQNYMIGIRLPWTLESEDNWNRTHAFAGKLWPWGAVVGMALALLFQSASLFIALGVLIVMVIWTGIYSYRIFQAAKKENP
ncbi:MAG: SdpI family protein [Candidatus Kapaibacterium sp.]